MLDLVIRGGRVVTPSGVGEWDLGVQGERIAFRDVGFRATQTTAGTYALDFELLARRTVPTVSLPGFFGARVPTYDRVDGVSLGYGPEIALDTGRIRLDPALTYRSQLGVVDPSVEGTWEPGRRTAIEARLARTTLTNDAWMRGDAEIGHQRRPCEAK